MQLSPEDRALIEAARRAQPQAYAPYSGYAVGAAVRTADGRLFTGCNIENASYGLSICAERVAVFRAVADGARSIVAVAIVTRDGAPPCGACRQVLMEFASKPEECLVWIATPDQIMARHTLSELLPNAFVLPPHSPL
jgi:cytidine deaminase